MEGHGGGRGRELQGTPMYTPESYTHLSRTWLSTKLQAPPQTRPQKKPIPRRRDLVHPPLNRATGLDTLPGFGGYFRAHTTRWSFCPLQHRLLCLRHIVELVGSALRNLLGAPHPKQRILGGISCRKQVRFPSMARVANLGSLGGRLVWEITLPCPIQSSPPHHCTSSPATAPETATQRSPGQVKAHGPGPFRRSENCNGH